MKSTKPNKRIVLKLIDLLGHGLTAGLGKQKPGQMCVEAAVCAAYGLPHGDEPPCVGGAVRAFKVKLNDCNWPSNEARAEGMKGLAIAQLGSDTLDQLEFGKLMILRGTQELLPFVFRETAEKLSDDKKKIQLEWADKLAAVTTFEEARSVSHYASASVYASAYASTYASASAYASAYAYAYAAASASASVYASAFASAFAYASASADASADASASADFKHSLLKLTAAVGLKVLIEMKSPGCKWLSLLDAPSVVKPQRKTVTASSKS